MATERKTINGREFERRKLLARTEAMMADIEITQNTIRYWNSLHPEEEPISDDFSEVLSILEETKKKLSAASEAGQ